MFGVNNLFSFKKDSFLLKKTEALIQTGPYYIDFLKNGGKDDNNDNRAA
jgi:hypothetical protein